MQYNSSFKGGKIVKIIISRDGGQEKRRENTGATFKEEPAIKFLASLFEDEFIEGKGAKD